VTVKKAAVNAFVVNKDCYSIIQSRCLSRRLKAKLSLTSHENSEEDGMLGFVFTLPFGRT
jgi:hypothetical protein